MGYKYARNMQRLTDKINWGKLCIRLVSITQTAGRVECPYNNLTLAVCLAISTVAAYRRERREIRTVTTFGRGLI